MSSPHAFVKISPRDPVGRFSQVIKGFERDYVSMIKEIEQKALKIIKDNTPSSGITKNSWEVSSSIGTDLRATINLRNPLPQSVYLNTGTKPSAGRYVPVLNRRITTGTHPGIKGTGYIDKSVVTINNLTIAKTKDLINKMRANGRRLLKG
jgi:hypothetical protein